MTKINVLGGNSGGGGGGGGSDVMVIDHGDGTVDVTVAGGGGFSLTDNGDGTVNLTLDGETVTLGGEGAPGVGIASVALTDGDGSPGTTDTYTITFTDATTSTFTVYNGADGADGADGISGVTVQDEGSPLSTAATTLNFVGAGVTASGTGATKTITISGGGAGSVASDALFDAKGDLPVGTGADAAARLAAGTDGYSLVADSSQTTGLKWVPRSRVAAEVHADTTIVNTTTETDAVSLTLPTSLAAGDLVRLSIWADQLNNSGSTVNYTYRVKLGSTTVLDSSSQASTTSSQRIKVAVTVEVLIESTTAQRVRGIYMGTRGTASWPSTLMPTAPLVGYGTAAEDLTIAKTLKFTVQPAVAAATVDFVVHGATLEVIKKA